MSSLSYCNDHKISLLTTTVNTKKLCLLPLINMSISKVLSAREALFAFLHWLKNLSTAAREGTSVGNLTKSLESSSHQFHSICLVNNVQAPFHGCLCDGTKHSSSGFMFFARYSLKLAFKILKVKSLIY